MDGVLQVSVAELKFSVSVGRLAVVGLWCGSASRVSLTALVALVAVSGGVAVCQVVLVLGPEALVALVAVSCGAAVCQVALVLGGEVLGVLGERLAAALVTLVAVAAVSCGAAVCQEVLVLGSEVLERKLAAVVLVLRSARSKFTKAAVCGGGKPGGVASGVVPAGHQRELTGLAEPAGHQRSASRGWR